jgi:nucleotide-binding universal stress UspA family protein
MYKHILIATDGSEVATRAVAQGLALARQLNARVTAASVTEPWTAGAYAPAPSPSLVQVYEKAAAENAAAALASVDAAANRLGVSCATLHVKDRQPADGIIATGRAEGCDLIVVGSHGRRALARVLLGSVAMKVLTASPVPVLICR